MTNRVQILLIEDEKNICNFITTALEPANYKVISAFNATEGLSLATSLCPDVVLLDLGLPDMDGLEVIRQDVYKRQVQAPMARGSKNVDVMGPLATPPESNAIPTNTGGTILLIISAAI